MGLLDGVTSLGFEGEEIGHRIIFVPHSEKWGVVVYDTGTTSSYVGAFARLEGTTLAQSWVKYVLYRAGTNSAGKDFFHAIDSLITALALIHDFTPTPDMDKQHADYQHHQAHARAAKEVG